MKGYAVVCAVALFTTLLMTPVVIRLAKRFGAVVQPSSDARHVHTDPKPTLGGAAMFVGFLAAMAVASHMSQFTEMFADNSEPVGLLLGAGACSQRNHTCRAHERELVRFPRIHLKLPWAV